MEDIMLVNGGNTRRFLLCFFVASSFAVASTFFISSYDAYGKHFLSRGVRVWPKLELNWQSALATVIGFTGSAFGTVGGIGGGGIFVPMLNLIVGFDTKAAAALSKCMIMGASFSSVWYNLRVPHPTKEVPIIDYDLALLFQPMLMLGITIGVELSVVFPYWLITVLIIFLFTGTSSRSFFRGIQMWKQETLLKMEEENMKFTASERKDAIIDSDYEALLSHEEKSNLDIFLLNLKLKGILILLIVWSIFLVLQIVKNNIQVCSTMYWVINILQIPIAFLVFGWEAVKLWTESNERRKQGNCEHVCEASIEWSSLQLFLCALSGLLGGTVGGLLGSGGGFILGPLLLEIGVIPQVASSTATFVMLFSSSLSVVEFYFLGRFPIPYGMSRSKKNLIQKEEKIDPPESINTVNSSKLSYAAALYLIFVSLLAGFWGQFFVRKLVKFLKRASLIVFILATVIFTSALVMGVVGLQKTMYMIKEHQYMGFLSFCQH